MGLTGLRHAVFCQLCGITTVFCSPALPLESILHEQRLDLNVYLDHLDLASHKCCEAELSKFDADATAGTQQEPDFVFCLTDSLKYC